MNTRENLIDLIAKAKRAMLGDSGLNCELARNMYLADYLISHGVTVQQWVSVDERMPEEVGQPVLVLATNCYEQTYIVKAFLDYDSPGFFRTTEKQFDGIWGAWDVTHWMPLPEPPKED